MCRGLTRLMDFGVNKFETESCETARPRLSHQRHFSRRDEDNSLLRFQEKATKNLKTEKEER